jgi:hypothetical protein
MNIPEHRKAIDKLDAEIVKLLNERTKHVLQIGEIKLKADEVLRVANPRSITFRKTYAPESMTPFRKVGTARCAVRAAFSGATCGAIHYVGSRKFRPLVRGRGHRRAMSLPLSR